MSWFRRLMNLMRSNRLARDIDREMAFHITELMEDLVAGGRSEKDAREEAYRRFGHRTTMRERVWRVDVLGWLESLLADTRYATRALRANPGFTVVAVLSLGLGIGANTAIFSLINAVMLRALPVDHPEELVQITMDDGEATFTNPLWEQIRDGAGLWEHSLSGVIGFSDHDFNLTTGGVMRRANGAWVSGDYFSVLRIPAARGRLFSAADDRRGCGGVAVLSYEFWQAEYGGNDNVIGRTIPLHGQPYEIVGIAAPGFSGIHVGNRADVFAPLCTIDLVRIDQGILDARSTWFISVFGRLRPSTTLDTVREDLAAGSRGVFDATVPTHWTGDEQGEYRKTLLTAIPATNGMSTVRGQYREALLVLFVVVGVVLLIACANVAQLLLARATARQHEISVRLALGAARARLVRQLLTESVSLALLGAAVGVFFARWSSGSVVALINRGGRPVSLDLSLDLRVLGFTIAVATVTGILFAIAPAWRATRVAPQTALRGSGRGVVGSWMQRFARSIVIGQVALSLVLVVAAGLLVGSFHRLANVDPGFRTDGVLVVSASWSHVNVPAEQNSAYAIELLEQIRRIPGVRHASASFVLPIGGSAWNDYAVVEGYAPQAPRDALVWFNAVTDEYFETLGTPLLAGRDLEAWDRDGAQPVVIVNQTFARHFFGDASPLGKTMHINNHETLGPAMEIVGVVADAKYRRVDEEILPTAYVSLDQAGLWGPSVEIAVWSDGPPTDLVSAVTASMREVEPGVSLEFTTLNEQVATSLALPRLLATLSGFFGLLALGLAVIGLYGTISYNVASRRNEIGIRIALGAARTGMLGMVVGDVGRVVGIGVIVGAFLTLATTRLVAAFLYRVTPSDPFTLVLSALMLSSVAMLAGLVPAWRAASVDPMVTLREE